MLPKKNQPQKHPKKTNQDNTAPMGFALIIIVKNRKIATQNFLFNMHINVPFGNIKRLSFSWKICLNMIL
jgi:hypothetical protein